MIIKVKVNAAALLFILLLASCATVSNGTAGPERPAARKGLSPVQSLLLEGAGNVLGKTDLVVKGKRFNPDCTGTILAIYYYAGLDLAANFHLYSGNGVARLYKRLETEDLLYRTFQPAPGDIIFWDNTYDSNGDGQQNDPLTHAGMVVRAEPDGSIDYIHLNYGKGILIERMNLRTPEVYRKMAEGEMEIVNAPMRMKQKGKPHPAKWLASHLYRIFGMGYLLNP